MENWFRNVGRPALFEALTAACDRVGNDFDNSMLSPRDIPVVILKKYIQTDVTQSIQENAHLQAQLEPLRTKAASVEQLQQENRSLREEIQKLKPANEKYLPKHDSAINQGNTTRSLKRTVATPLAARSINETTPLKRSSQPVLSDIYKLKLPEMREEYLRLEDNYNKLHGRYLEVLNARTELDQRLREKIKNVEQWMDHANELNAQSQKRLRKVKRLEAQLVAVGENSTGFAASFSSDQSASVPTTAQKFQPSRPHVGNSLRDKSAGIQLVTDVGDFERDPCTDGQDLGQKCLTGDYTDLSTRENSCEDEAPSLPPIPESRDGPQRLVIVKNEPSSDSPVVVSERSVRKRRREVEDADNTPATTRVKTEDGCDPVVFGEPRHFAPQESMDFDAEVPYVQTPRKNRLRSFPGDDTGDTREPRLQDNSSSSTLQSRQQVLLSGLQNEKEPIATNATPSIPAVLHSITRPSVENDTPSRINMGAKARSADPTSIRRGINSLAEDGEKYRASRTSRSVSRGVRSSKILSDLLNSPSTNREATAPSTFAQPQDISTSKPAPPSKGFDFQVPARRDPAFSKGGLRNVKGSPQQTKSLALPRPRPAMAAIQSKRKSRGDGADDGDSDGKTLNPSSSPRTTRRAGKEGGPSPTNDIASKSKTPPPPLRERALSQLRLDDFRVNPTANEGYDYAFTDVVRGREERARGLSGCVRDSCCGQQFRALARAERAAAAAATGGEPPGFRALLEAYLGDDAWRLDAIAPPEREALWLEAKTRELADAHGRCRHRYQRMPSPPGYWRTGFPSTQEERDERAEGRRMEAEMIQERYREAMRPGGRWMFRDE